MSDTAAAPQQAEARPKWRLNRTAGLLICFTIAFLLAISRRHDPWYPYAEDGTIFYQQARELGLRSLFLPYGGYLHLVLRIISLVLAQFPPSLMPYAMVATALAIQAGVATYIFSDQISNLVPSQFYRGLFAFVYIGLPDIDEVYGHFVNSQWHLGVLSLLLIFGRAPATRAGKVCRLVLVGMLSLTGPFIAFLMPLTAYKLFRTRTRYNLGLLLCSVPSIAQVVLVLFHSERHARPWQFLLRPMVIPRTLGGRCLLSASISPKLFMAHYVDEPVLWAATFGLAVLCAYALFERKRFALLFLYLGAIILVGGLGQGSGTGSGFVNPLFANRFFFTFGFGLLATMILILASKKVPVQVATACGVAVMLAFSWQLPSPATEFWPKYQAALRRFNAAGPGTVVVFPERPDNWYYQVKKP